MPNSKFRFKLKIRMTVKKSTEFHNRVIKSLKTFFQSNEIIETLKKEEHIAKLAIHDGNLPIIKKLWRVNYNKSRKSRCISYNLNHLKTVFKPYNTEPVNNLSSMKLIHLKRTKCTINQKLYQSLEMAQMRCHRILL